MTVYQGWSILVTPSGFRAHRWGQHLTAPTLARLRALIDARNERDRS